MIWVGLMWCWFYRQCVIDCLMQFQVKFTFSSGSIRARLVWTGPDGFSQSCRGLADALLNVLPGQTLNSLSTSTVIFCPWSIRCQLGFYWIVHRTETFLLVGILLILFRIFELAITGCFNGIDNLLWKMYIFFYTVYCNFFLFIYFCN